MLPRILLEDGFLSSIALIPPNAIAIPINGLRYEQIKTNPNHQR
jgi:hypothetical protein